MPSTLIPSEFVPVDFMMDPKTETMISGDELQDGMVVLIEDHLVRSFQTIESPEELAELSRYERRRLMENSRWCRVSHLRRDVRDPHVLEFAATYADGTMMSRAYSRQFWWYVKLDSMHSDGH